MAAYTIAAGDIAAWAKTLVAATVDTVTIQRRSAQVKVVNDTGDAAIYFTVDGTVPTSGGATTYRVPAVAYAETTVDALQNSTVVVKLISSGTPTYSVEGAL